MCQLAHHQAGFTLLEVIVAMAILTFGLVGVLQAVTSSQVTARFAEDYTTAAMLAELKVMELTTMPDRLADQDAGDFGELYPRFAWESQVETTPLEGLLKLRVTITWRSGLKTRSFTAETCIPEPEEEEEEEATGSR